MAIKVENQLDEAHRTKLRIIAQVRGVSVDTVIQSFIERKLDEIEVTPELTNLRKGRLLGQKGRPKHNSLIGAESVDWSDDPGTNPHLYGLQLETLSIAE